MIYRYFSEIDYLIDLLENKRLYFSSVEYFNDPYEKIAIIKDKNTDAIFVNDDIKNKHKVCCFSKENDNYLLWSHYANNHKGFCVGFDFESISKNINGNTFVEYNDQLVLFKDIVYKQYIPKVDKDNIQLDNQSVIELLTNKYSFWGYEREVRAIIKYPEHEYFYFPELSIKCVITGIETNSSTEKIIQSVLKGNYQNVIKNKCSLNLVDGVILIR